jgi:transcriptional regulator with XRE-family HTH domain
MELQSVLTSIAESVREERARAGLTLDQLAQRADLSIAHLSRIESGDRQPSVAALISLARALGVSVSSLLGEGRRDQPAISVYTGAEPSHQANGLTIASCSGFPGSSTLEALRITIDPDRIAPTPARHRGEEWIYVVAGSLRLEFDGDTFLVNAGHTAHFDANRPHRLGAHEVVTEVLVLAADAPVDLRNHPLFTTSISFH